MTDMEIRAVAAEAASRLAGTTRHDFITTTGAAEAVVKAARILETYIRG